jgi:thiol-disulfide isomerase/thioredoxin
MNQRRALWVAVVAGVLTVATVALLAYRVLVLGGLPPGDTIPDSLRSPPQLSPEAAQAEVDAIMALTLDDLDGRPQAMAQWRGKVLVVNYWASWCKPCVEEMPAFSRLYSRYAAQGVQFVGIGIDEVDNMRRLRQGDAGFLSAAGRRQECQRDAGPAGQGAAVYGGHRARWALREQSPGAAG